MANTAWVLARLCKLQKSALDSQPQVKLTSCFPMVGGNLVEIRIPNEEQTENFFGILISTRRTHAVLAIGSWITQQLIQA
jgi:hypothetical protein